nr:metalloregulator ArsR/SmtB family transcription factor [Halochromatium salexigens]
MVGEQRLPSAESSADPEREECGQAPGDEAGQEHGYDFSELALFADDADIERASRSLKAMSHPLRLKILCTLGDEEVSVQHIVEHVGTSQSNISQHLAILRDKGILAARKDANRVYYRVGDARTLRLIVMMREVFCSRTP